MPAGQIIGRISVKVLPDTDSFKQVAKAELEKIEKLLDFTVKVELDKKALQNVKRELENWRKGQDPLKITVRPDLLAGSTTAISARLRVLTRPRSITLVPRIDNAAVARVATALAALSGARVLNNIFENLFRRLMRLDEAVPLIGTLALAIAGLGTVGITAVSNLAALSASLASIAPAALALPGIFGGLAIGLGVTVAAFVDFNKVLPEVGIAFKALQNQISENFWAKAAEPIRELISTLFPQLSAGLRGAATELGSYFGSLATSLKGAFDGALAGMFADLHASIAITSGGTDALAGIIRTLGEVGAGYLPRLAQWFVDITTQFNTFLGAAAADGRLQGWIDTAITALGELARVIGSVGSILAGIASAATAGGGSTLGMVADTLERVAAAVNSVDGQNALSSVFRAAHEAMSQITTISGPAMTEFFSTLAKLLTTVLPIAGSAIGTLLAGLATGLSSPGLSEGLIAMFEGLGKAITGLAPAFGPLGAALGQIAGVVGVLAQALGPVLGVALAAISMVLAALLPALTPIIQILGGALMQIVTALAPLLQMIGIVLGEVLTAIAPLLPVIIDLVMSALTPLIDIIITILEIGLPPLIAGLKAVIAALTPIIGVIADVVGWLLGQLGPVIEWLAGVLQDVLAATIERVGAVFKGWVTFMTNLWNIFSAFFSGDWDQMWSAIKKHFTDIWNAIVAVFQWVQGLLTGIWNTIVSAIKAAWDLAINIVKDRIDAAINFVKELPGKAKDALSNLGSTLIDAGKKLIQGLIDGITGMFGKVKDSLVDLTKKLTDWKGPESTDKVLLVNAGQLIIDGLIKGMESRYGAVRKSLEGLTGDIGGMTLASPTISGVDAANLGDRASASIDASRDGESGGTTKVLNYYAAPGASISSEEDLFKAASRSRMVGW